MVGRPVGVARCKLAVADVRRDHELLGDHDVHGDEVTLEGLDAAVSVVLFVAPVVLEVEQGLRLNITIKVCLVSDGGWVQNYYGIPGRLGLPSKPQSTPSPQCTRRT